jgi:hypothetical protein
VAHIHRPTIVALGERRRGAAAVDEWLRPMIDEAFAERRPNVPASEVFKRLRPHHARRLKDRLREKS